MSSGGKCTMCYPKARQRITGPVNVKVERVKDANAGYLGAVQGLNA